MLKFLQKILVAVLVLVFAGPSVPALAAQPMGLAVNGQPVENMSVNPVILQDRMMVPARDVFERLGAVVEWRAETRSVYIRANNRIVAAPVDQGPITLDGSAIDVPVPAQIINDFAMVPVAAVAVALGYEVDFRDHTVFINSPSAPEPELTFETVPEPPPLSFPDAPESPVTQELPPLVLPELPDIPLPEVPMIHQSPNSLADQPGEQSDNQSNDQSFDQSTDQPFDQPDAQPGELPAADIAVNTPPEFVPAPPEFVPVPPVTPAPPVQPAPPIPPMSPAQPAQPVSPVQGGAAFNTLRNIYFESAPEQDTLTLQGVSPQNIEIESRPGTLTIRLNNVFMQTEGVTELGGHFARRVSINRFTQFSGALLVTVADSTTYSVRPGINETVIVLHPPTFRNIYYEFAARTLRIPKTGGFSMDTNAIVHQDLYHQRIYNLNLPVDASGHLGFGELMVGDQLLRSVNINTVGALTQLQLRGNQVFAVLVEEDDEYYLIRILQPREKYARIVVLDAGHGGRFPGAVRGSIRETDLNMLVQNKLIQLLQSEGSIRVYTIRNSDVNLADDLSTDLLMRSQFGNAIGDIFISLHHNAATNTAVHGAETFYFATPADNMRTLTSRRLAEIMHRHKLQQLGSHDRGVRSGNFSVLRNSQIPAALLEFGFMSNPEELARMNTPEFQWAAARAAFNGLLEAFEHLPVRQVRG